MKNFLVFTFALLFVGSLSAQEVELPKKGAKLHVENTTIELAQNTSTSFDVWVVRSKVARKAKFDAPRLSTSLFEYTVDVDPTNKDHYTVTINTGDLQTGTYSISLTGKSFSYHKVAGKVLNFNVSDAAPLVSKDGE